MSAMVPTGCLQKPLRLRPAPLSYAAKCHYVLGGDGGEKHAVQDVREAGKDLRWDISEGV